MMRNRGSREATVVRRVVTALGEVVAPDGSVCVSDLGSSAVQPDARLFLRFPGGEVAVDLQVKVSGLPTRECVRRLGPPRERAATLVVAPFLSGAVRDELRRHGYSYWDETGNMLIQSKIPFIRVQRDGASRNPDPSKDEGVRRLRTLKGRSASIVVVRLLTEGGATSVRELARVTGVGVATASRVIDLLREDGRILETDAHPIIVADRARLAQRWVEDYSFAKTFGVTRYSSILGEAMMLESLRAIDVAYAMTGTRAASRLFENAGRVAPLPPTGLWLYTDDRSAIERELDLVPDSRGEVLVADGDFLHGSEGYVENARYRYVRPWRIVGDLLSSPGRDATAGHSLMDALLNGDSAQ